MVKVTNQTGLTKMPKKKTIIISRPAIEGNYLLSSVTKDRIKFTVCWQKERELAGLYFTQPFSATNPPNTQCITSLICKTRRTWNNSVVSLSLLVLDSLPDAVFWNGQQ